MTLQRKILLRMFLLTALLILAMSGTYYYLFTRDIRQRSHDSLTMVFSQVSDDLHTRVRRTTEQLDQFIQTALVKQMYMLDMVVQQHQGAEHEMSVGTMKRLMSYVHLMITKMQEFGTLVDATEIQIYDLDGALLALYQHEENEAQTWAYLPDFKSDALVSIRPDERWYAVLQALEEVPVSPLPDNVLLHFDRPFPESTSVGFETVDDALVLQFVAPILERGNPQGICVVSFAIQQHDVERYSRLSGTHVNVFAGTTLSVGTLSEYQNLSEAFFQEQQQQLDLFVSPEIPPIIFSQMKAGGHSYYQGTLIVGNGEEPMGAISVHFPRHLEEAQKQRFFVLAAGLALGFSILAIVEAVGLSSVIVRPVTHLMEVMQMMKTGKLDVQAPVETDDEIGQLAQNFNRMSARLKESFRRIEQQNDDLKKLDKLKDEFLSNTSHELRTPLNGIAGLADAMLSGADGPLTQEERKHTQMILQSSRRLSGMVDSILDYSKARSEKLTPKVQAFELDQVVDLVLTLAQPQLKNRPLALSMDFPEDLPKVFGDIDQVGQILTNLVGNAVKFTREGEVVVSAETLTHQPPLLEKEGEGLFVKITVRDTGIGIPEQALDRIFEAFEQVDGSASREFGGTGLGLAITKELAVLHGSDIGVESEEGVGSRFFFTLPCFPEAIPSYQNTLRPVPLFSQSSATGFAQSDTEATSFGESGLPRPESGTSAGETDRALSRSEDSAPGETPEDSSKRWEKSFISSANKGKRIMIIDDDTVSHTAFVGRGWNENFLRRIFLCSR